MSETFPHATASSYERPVRCVLAILWPDEVPFFQQARRPSAQRLEALRGGIVVWGFREEFLTARQPRG